MKKSNDTFKRLRAAMKDVNGDKIMEFSRFGGLFEIVPASKNGGVKDFC